MNDNFKICTIEAAESISGDVAGKLNHIGAWLIKIENNNGVMRIEAKIPNENIKLFSEWLNKFANGNGVIHENA